MHDKERGLIVFLKAIADFPILTLEILVASVSMQWVKALLRSCPWTSCGSLI